MKTVPISDLFDVRYGHSLELNALTHVEKNTGVAFVSRKMGDNGISAYVKPIEGIEPAKAGELSCALGGNGVLTTHLQEAPFYVGRDVAILRPRGQMTKAEALYYCLCVRLNRYRYNYGRQANKTLSELKVPSSDSIPSWVSSADLSPFENADAAVLDKQPILPPVIDWEEFRYQELFDIRKGRRLTKAAMKEGSTPFIGAIETRNGHRQSVDSKPIHQANTITISYNGSVAEAFYQPAPFWASDDVNVLYPKFDLNAYIAMFLCALMRKERFRFSYGRKWNLERMLGSTIRLPVDQQGQPNWELVEAYMKSLRYSASIAPSS